MSTKTKVIILLLSIVKLWLIVVMPLTAWGISALDDRLFLDLAHSLIRGEWLGTYSERTLAKGPMYPIWIAINFYVGLPLLLAQHLLFLCAGLVLITALQKIVKYPSLLIFLYALIIFSPHLETLTRVVRGGIYPALSLLILAGLIGLYANRSNKLINFGLWAVFLGVILTAFWLTREEGIWIMPSVILIIAYVLFLIYRTEKLSLGFFKRSVICLLPLLILFGGLQVVSLINKVYYNSYNVVEVKSESFLSAYGALSRVKHPNWKRYLPVPREVRQSIYQASPAFKELEYFIEEKRRGWQTLGCIYKNKYPQVCGDIMGALFMWALRDVVALAGYYKSGDVAERYYLRLATEVNTACDKGILDCFPKRATLIPPFKYVYIELTLEAFWRGIKFLVQGFNYSITKNPTSKGTEESQILFKDITREQLAPLPLPKVRKIHGWAFSFKEKQVYFQVKKRQSNILETFSVKKFHSPVVYQHAKNKTGKDYEPAKNARFIIISSCLEQCDLLIFDNQSLLATVNIDTKKSKLFSNDLWFHIDAITTKNQKENLSLQNELNKVKIAILKKIAILYKLVIPWLCGFAIVAYVMSFGIGILRRKFTFLFILNTAIIGAIVARLLILALIDVISFPAISFLYMSPLFPFLQVFLVLAIVDLMSFKSTKMLFNTR